MTAPKTFFVAVNTRLPMTLRAIGISAAGMVQEWLTEIEKEPDVCLLKIKERSILRAGSKGLRKAFVLFGEERMRELRKL